MTRLVIFDCDGVLIESERIAVRVDQRVLADLGWDLSENEIVERFVGRSPGVFERAIEEQLGRALPADWEQPYLAWYRAALEQDLEQVAGVGAAIDGLQRTGHATCVASSSSHDRLRFTLGLVGLLERFEGRIFSSEDVVHGKPAPDLFELAARRLATTPERCIVVEDSPPGVRAALAAGMPVLAYAGGVVGRQSLEPLGPSAVFQSMHELPRLVAQIEAGRRPESSAFPSSARDAARPRPAVPRENPVRDLRPGLRRGGS